MNVNFDFNYEKYADDNNLWSLLNINKEKYGNIHKKIIPNDVNYSVNPKVLEPYPVEMDDLIRIHYAIRKFRIITAIEIGSGKSTAVIADALKKNKKDFELFVSKELRKNNSFELHSVETSEFWANEVLNNMPNSLKDFCTMHIVSCKMDEFNSRICTTFDNFPNVCPDFIYLDGPDQYAPSGDINGIGTQHPDRMPMVSDLIKIEPFLLPGTVIMVDGRTANARFMKNNFQSKWSYRHYEDIDIHVFVNIEQPLGRYNKKELDFKMSVN